MMLDGGDFLIPPPQPPQIPVRRVIVSLCEPCIKGEGKMCNTPECVMCRHLVDIPFIEEVMEDADRVLGDLVRQRDEAESAGEAWKREVDYWKRMALQAGETIQRQDAQRQRDALDGQAALDEANNAVVKNAENATWWMHKWARVSIVARQLAKALQSVSLSGSEDQSPLYSWCDDGWLCEHSECKAGRDALFAWHEVDAPTVASGMTEGNAVNEKGLPARPDATPRNTGLSQS